MKIVAYIRVSTRDQKAMYGPARQRAAITAWAKRHKHRIAFEVMEDVSGTVPPSMRAGWTEAIDAACSEDAEGVVVADLSRLSRDLIAQEMTLRDVSECGARLFSASEDEQRSLEDPDDPQRKMIRRIVGAVNDYDRSMIVARMQAGRQLKKAAGGYAGGQPPFGYRGRAGTGELVPDEREQFVLFRMHELTREGCSTRVVAERLNSEGLRTRRGGLWSSPMVSRHLRAPRPTRVVRGARTDRRAASA